MGMRGKNEDLFDLSIAYTYKKLDIILYGYTIYP